MTVDKLELGISLHTALRKCCDSSATTKAYMAICDLPDELWAGYVAKVARGLSALPVAPKRWTSLAVEAVTRVSLRWAGKALADRENDRSMQGLASAFLSFDSSDWLGYCEYLRHCVKNGKPRARKP